MSEDSKACPQCHSVERVLPILWGFPSADVDFAKYFIGGCVVDSGPEPDAAYVCETCGIEFGLREEI